MDYEQKYKEALERASKLKVQNPFDTVGQMVEHIFPELQESEDERIRKSIIAILDNYIDDDNTIKPAIMNWLEKQGEKKPADKVEPKFKIRDWIANGGANPCYVKSIFGDYYELCSCEGFEYTKPIIDVNYTYHLWTIQDAKDGDVLLEEETGEPFIYNGNRATYFLGYFLGAHCGISNGEFNPLGNNHNWGKNSCPSTKEQRDLLFTKMKEAGYEWDSEKKELKKIEVKTLNADKVIEWLDDQACQGWIEDVEVDKFVEKFKKDFGL
jgi:hypothetical protein